MRRIDFLTQAQTRANSYSYTFLFEFVQLSYYLLVEVEYTTVVLAQLLDYLRRYEATAYELLHCTLGNPLRILHVTLATWKLLDEIRVGKIQLEVWRQHTPYGNPVDAGALH